MQDNQEQEKSEYDSFILDSNKLLLEKIKIKNVRQGSGNSSFVYLVNDQNELFNYVYPSGSKNAIVVKDEVVKKTIWGYLTGLVLTESGTVYCMGTNDAYKTLCIKDKTNIKEHTPYKVQWFLDRDIKIREIGSGSITNYFISTDNVLYSNGYNSSGQMGTKVHSNIPFPQKIMENVDRVFSSPHAHHTFVTTLDDKVMSFGGNTEGLCGVGNNQQSIFEPQVVPNISGSSVKKMVCSTASVLLFRDGRLFTCGPSSSSGLKANTNTFKPVPGLEDKHMVSIGGGSSVMLAISSENEVYAWKRGVVGVNVDCKLQGNELLVKIRTPQLIKGVPYKICSSPSKFLIIPALYEETSFQNQEFLILLESGKFSDHTLMLNDGKFKIHKSLVEIRTKKSVDEIEEILKQHNEKEIKIFLKWVYTANIENYTTIKEICIKLGLDQFYKNSLFQDLEQLFKEESSKNFKVLVQDEEYDDEDDDEEEDNDDKEEEAFEEIPVHNYILYARSGLFREMFENITNESNSVKDFSGKTIESMEIFIKYLYTNKINLTADDDPQLVAEELSDAVDYYQLNKYSNLPFILKQIN
ncbi:hypothetical protein M0813_17060 [Anaeramoeba flamelloides]|uniref:BTB domain-containing protein n=1 Tax=Anaeramoeba flamelloides TaxID=1746091 RepID=A0ABQ8YYG3_9EUKA|nr:hypothetical protein M0813_17060 [Anaeramoeba flamelloides]